MAEVLTGVNEDIMLWASELYNMTPEKPTQVIGVNR